MSSSLADFEILEHLGSGSFGSVYKVTRQLDGKSYVMKVIRIQELSMQGQVDAINEVKILSRLDSPYVVKYYDSFIDKRNLNIIMEYCNKKDLQVILKKALDRKSCLKEDFIWNIFLQTISGLYYIHKQKVLHRDLKSANVFLSKSDENSQYYQIKIGDLGVAKMLETSTAFAQTVVGTPYYLSPELCSDKPYRDKSDVWALGILLYECCFLCRPFEAKSQYSLILKILSDQVSFTHAIPGFTVSNELKRMILWMLQKDSSKRPTVTEIFNEAIVREKIIDHHIQLPKEVEGMEITHHISFLSTRTMKKVDDVKTTTATNYRNAVRSQPSTRVLVEKKTIQGNRIRGPMFSQRSISERSKSRYQVKTPTSLNESISNNEVKSDSKFSLEDELANTNPHINCRRDSSKSTQQENYNEYHLEQKIESDNEALDKEIEVEYPDDFEEDEDDDDIETIASHTLRLSEFTNEKLINIAEEKDEELVSETSIKEEFEDVSPNIEGDECLSLIAKIMSSEEEISSLEALIKEKKLQLQLELGQELFEYVNLIKYLKLLYVLTILFIL